MEALEIEQPPQCRAITNKAFEELYEQAFPLVARFVSKMGGTFMDAKDIFHDALIIFYEKQTANTIAVQVADEAYILGIAKHLWLSKFNQEKGNISFDDLEQDISIPEDFYTEDKETNRLFTILQITGRKCLELLRAFYYDKLDLQNIAQSFGYGTVRSATAQKYKCLEKVRNQVKEKAINYGDLAE